MGHTMRKTSPLLVATTLMLASIMFPPTSAGDLNVSWDPSTDATGYRIHYGPNPSQYDNSFDVGNATQTSLDTLGDCMTWYFAATAYNAAGESGYSEEVASWSRPVLEQASPNVAEQGRQLDVSLSGTNFQGGATVSFSDPAIVVNSVTVLSCTELSVNLTVGNVAGVGPVVVVVAHPNGVSGESSVLFAVEAAVPPTVTATTPPDGAIDVGVDVRPTVRFSEPVTIATISTATVRLLDDAGSPVAQASGSPSLSPDGTVATLTPAVDLDQGRTYRIEARGGSVGVHDLAGHPMEATYTQSAGFLTVPDTTAPTISDVAASTVGSTTATIGWTTDEASSSQVLYRKLGQTDYQQTAVDESLVTLHSVSLQGLAPNTSYEFQVRSVDGAGNAASNSGQTFATTDNAYTYVVFETESGTLSVPIQVVEGADAFGGAWIEMTSGSGSPGNPQGIATFGVHLPAAGEWFLWVRAYAPNSAADSWLTSVDGGSWSELSAPATGDWLWQAGGSYVLVDGLHTLELGGLDSGARADRILLTDDPDFVPAEQPGSDLTPPMPVTQFDATPLDGSNLLTWTNPSDPDFARIVIRYRTDGVYPRTTVDGYPVLDSDGSPGSVESHAHQGLTNGVTYLYSAFAVDALGNEAPAAEIEAMPEPTPSPPLAPANVKVF